MIDLELLVSISFALAIPAPFIRPYPPSAVPHGVIDTALGALAAGLVAPPGWPLVSDNLTGAWSMLFTGVQRWLARSGWPPV